MQQAKMMQTTKSLSKEKRSSTFSNCCQSPIN